MQEKLKQLKSLLGVIHDLDAAASLLGWDQQTYMPPGGSEQRGEQQATLSSLTHSKMTSDEMACALEDCQAFADSMDMQSDDACLIRAAQREFDKLTRVPEEWVSEFARMTSTAQDVWMEARAGAGFDHFRPSLERIVELKRQYADFFAPYEHVYDPLLDTFERGMKTSDVKAVFSALRPQQVALIQEIMQRPQVDDSFLHVTYEEQGQWDFGVDVISRFGFDWDHGRQDKSAHPFTIDFGLDDVRITTRVIPDYLPTALFGTMHECGHAMYQQGISTSLRRTLLIDGASLGVHESQSRLWENLVGRSRAFWKFFYPSLQERFPSQLGAVDMETFYKGINKVEPSLVRVEADEATYNLHIMLRLELEIELMEGSLQVADLPEAWNARMREFLGVVPPDDAQGVLQDIHWSAGLMGYFPTYALGNLISAQLWESVLGDIPDIEEQIEQGEFVSLLGWMRDKIHQHGAKYEPQQLIENVTGSKIDPQPYLRYLRIKYAEIYGL
jgi:carboxypeptidase Taq